MELFVSGMLGRNFGRSANEQAYRRVLWHNRERQERDRRQKQEEFQEEASDLIDLASTIITSEQIEQFQAELDVYQEATYEALSETDGLLEFAEINLEQILSRAHTLEDGRRVFKTEDGLRVFDEFGTELTEESIQPDEIDDSKPRWEHFLNAWNERDSLIQQRAHILEFQSDLDEAQELLDSGQMTQAQFDDLSERLAADAPDTVKARIQEIGSDNEVTAPSSALNGDINLDAELSAMPIPKPSVPGMG